MDLCELQSRLVDAIAPHDLLKHPFYEAWNRGQLTLTDLAGYAAEYRHSVEQFPSLLKKAQEQTSDAQTLIGLSRNLDEEEGRLGNAVPSHLELWLRFGEAMGADRQRLLATQPSPETRASNEGLAAVVNEGELASLAALWAYEFQTAKVSATKRQGLVERYAVSEPRALTFFAVHQELDVHHAADLLAGVARACEREGQGAVERACQAAARSAQAQWLFLDGAETLRAPAPAAA